MPPDVGIALGALGFAGSKGIKGEDQYRGGGGREGCNSVLRTSVKRHSNREELEKGGGRI